jgi:hypothetical protein
MAIAGAPPADIEALAKGDASEVIATDRRKNLERMIEAAGKGQRVPALSFASAYADLGQIDLAFEWLEKAFAAREPLFVFFKIHPRYDRLRSDPRFADLVRRMGLTG